MTTTEWAERYSEAFRDAGLFQDRESKWKRMAYLQGSFTRLPPVVWRPIPGGEELIPKKCFIAKDWFLNIVGRGDIALVKIPEDFPLPVNGEVVEIDGVDRIISSVEIMKDNFGRRAEVGLVCRPGARLVGDPGPGSSGTPEEISIPSNPSPFEPKEVVDDGQKGQFVLNRKESTITVLCSRGQPYEMGKEEYQGLAAMGMLWEFYPDAPSYWPL